MVWFNYLSSKEAKEMKKATRKVELKIIPILSLPRCKEQLTAIFEVSDVPDNFVIVSGTNQTVPMLFRWMYIHKPPSLEYRSNPLYHFPMTKGTAQTCSTRSST